MSQKATVSWQGFRDDPQQYAMEKIPINKQLFIGISIRPPMLCAKQNNSMAKSFPSII